MALDFPSSPTNGQQYGGYTYNSTIGAWQTNTSTVAPATVTDTRPTNPTNGDMWFNTADGTLYFYYNDGSSAQWVEARAPITNDGYYSPNYILNSAFDIWQRGTSGTPTSAATRYVADRWETFRPAYVAGMTVSRQTATDTTLLPNIQYCMRVQRTAANTSTVALVAAQALETVNSIPLAGKTVTLSFYARAGANFSSASSLLTAQVVTGTGTDQNQVGGFTGTALPINQTATLTTSWQRFSYTGLLSSTTNQVGLWFSYPPVGTAGTNDYFEITGVQLEESAAAMPFHRQTPSIQAELAACQRYFYAYTYANNPNTDIAYLGPTSSTSAYGPFFYPVPMRAVPVVTVSSASHFRAHVPGVIISNLSSVTAGPDIAGTLLYGGTASAFYNLGQIAKLQFVGTAGSYIYISAEL